MDAPKRGAMEPEVIELTDGKLLMIARTQLGHIATAVSKDGGDHWGGPGQLSVRAPEAPATIRRVPATGDLLLVWNSTYDPKAGHGGKRTPLTAAVSNDEGKTWKWTRHLEKHDSGQYHYPAVIQAKDGSIHAVYSYFVAEGKSMKHARFNEAWVKQGD